MIRTKGSLDLMYGLPEEITGQLDNGRPLGVGIQDLLSTGLRHPDLQVPASW